MTMKFVIGPTTAGLTLKEDIIKYLEDNDHQVCDVGMKRDGQ